ncbi:MAG: hypothetical protein ABIK44_00040 [candidate division WOR-3 bacterium]
MPIYSRQNNALADRTLLYAVFLILVLLPLTANAKIVVKIYGKGGIQIIPPAVCPQQDPALCATIEIEDYNASEGVVEDAFSSNKYQALLAEPIPDGLTGMQGSDLQLESLEPIE